MVYDVTDPIGGPHVPLTRPHAVLEPFQPPDRILFGSPVASVAFVQNDWPLTQTYSQTATVNSLATALTGLLCNPNPNVDTSTPTSVADGLAAEQGPFSDNGAYYRNAISFQEVALGPNRLRGVFGFATLTNGSVIAIDVDDWDAPCRRPDPVAPPGGSTCALVEGYETQQTCPATYIQANSGTQAEQIADRIVDGPFSAVAPPEPFPSSSSDTNPYHTPVAFQTAYTDTPTSLEWFFPVSAPHRARSGFTLNNTAVNGNHAPYLLGVPQLFALGAPLATQGPQALGNPSLVPTDSPFVDPSVTTNPAEPNPLGRTLVFSPAVRRRRRAPL